MIKYNNLSPQQKLSALRGVLKIHLEKKYPYTMKWKKTDSIADDIYFNFDIDSYFIFEPVEGTNGVKVSVDTTHANYML